jgi:type IV pilus assembly protein PilV
MNTMSTRNTVMSPHGYTLVELLIAMLLLVVGIMGVFTVFWASTFSGRSSRDMTTVASLGQEVLERLSAQSYTTLAATAGFVNYSTVKGVTVQKQIQENTPEAGMKTVSVKLVWDESGNRKERVLSLVRRSDY